MLRLTNILFLFIMSSALFSDTTVIKVKAGHPYHDHFFTYDSKPFNSTPAQLMNRSSEAVFDFANADLQRAAIRDTHTSPVANLQLWVPDNASVIINGQQTRPQALGGVHRFCRIFDLRGLTAEKNICEITVTIWDANGIPMSSQSVLKVIPGGQYRIRYPNDFQIPNAILVHNFETQKHILETGQSLGAGIEFGQTQFDLSESFVHSANELIQITPNEVPVGLSEVQNSPAGLAAEAAIDVAF